MDKTPSMTVDKDQLKQAQSFWAGFMKFTKVGGIAVIILLILMAIFLL